MLFHYINKEEMDAEINTEKTLVENKKRVIKQLGRVGKETKLRLRLYSTDKRDRANETRRNNKKSTFLEKRKLDTIRKKFGHFSQDEKDYLKNYSPSELIKVRRMNTIDYDKVVQLLLRLPMSPYNVVDAIYGYPIWSSASIFIHRTRGIGTQQLVIQNGQILDPIEAFLRDA